MATESIMPVNGNYAAASHTSSQSANLANGAIESASASSSGKDEVGWYFVEQYYTTMSRSPEKVHLFYNKRSQFVYGVEAEKVPVSVGQKAINERIAELGIEDCKVRVTNVDSQESGKSIVLQVIGEMSVKGQPHRKFTQTFILAEQPNGYFVLNDIFRYIADEPEDEEELEAAPETSADAPAETQDIKTLTSSDNIAEQARSAEVVDKKLEKVATPEVPTIEATTVDQPASTEAEPADEPAPAEEASQLTASTVAEPEVLEAEKPKDPSPTPAATPAPAPAQAAPPQESAAPAPAPSKPAAPKTWASMLAGPKAPPAVPVVPVPANNAQAPAKPAPAAAAAAAATAAASAAPAATAPDATAQAAPTATSTATADSEVPPSPGGWQTAGQEHNKKGGRNQAGGVVNGYIKNVTAQIDAGALRTHLSQYGKLSYFDVSRPKSCAFIEFETPAGFNAAVAANPHKVNGEEIIVEERRPRANTFNQNFRGGARGGRGNMDGRTPSQGGRGGPAGRGGFTPRGRGGPAARGRGNAQEA